MVLIFKMKAVCAEFISMDGIGNPTGLLAGTVVDAIVWSSMANVATIGQNKRPLVKLSNSLHLGWISREAIELRRWPMRIIFRIDTYWFIPSNGGINAVRRWSFPCTVAGMLRNRLPLHTNVFDGMVDGCTATLTYPHGIKYNGKKSPVPPIWPPETLRIIVRMRSALECTAP